jgi:Tol biopolymer transport system component
MSRRNAALLRITALAALALVAGAGPATAQSTSQGHRQPADHHHRHAAPRSAGWSGPLSVSQLDAPPAVINGFQTRLSTDGRRAMFSTLVPNGSGGVDERLAVRDLPRGVAAVFDAGGFQLAVMSADGRFAGYALPNDRPSTSPMGNYDVWVRDLATGAMTDVSVAPDGGDADGRSFGLELSSTGRFAAFGSNAGNLVGGDSNGAGDVFVRDLSAGVTTRVSVASDGTEADAAVSLAGLSSTGRYVLLRSAADNLVPGDFNGITDLFIHDTQTGTTTRVDVADDRTQADAAPDSTATVSTDGRYVAFTSAASTLTPGDSNALTDVFVRDLRRGHTTRITGTAGTEPDGRSLTALISADGSALAFASDATNLVAGDTNGGTDVFVRDLTAGRTVRVSVRPDGTQTSTWAAQLDAITADGRTVAFNLPNQGMNPGSTDNSTHAFLVRPRSH